MFDRRFQPVVLLMIIVGVSAGQSRKSPTQSPRQAIIEMLSGGEAPFKRHLTVEMQNKLEQMMKDSPSGADPLQALTAAQTANPDNFQAFDLGPILFSFNNPAQHERYEVQIDAEDPRGDEDVMGLSLHLVRNGMEQETPAKLHVVLNMKRQEGMWRLNAITLSATLPVGDPRILDNSWWGTALFAATGSAPDVQPTVVLDGRAKMTPLRAVRMIGGGIYNGYRFTLAGCDRKPSRAFRVVAEPVAGKGKAYCSDHTNNLRASDDGRGVTCLMSGKVARR